MSGGILARSSTMSSPTFIAGERMKKLIVLLALVLGTSAFAQQKTEAKPEEKTPAKSAPADAKKPAEAKPEEKKDETAAGEEKPVVMHHSIRVGSKTLNYTTTTGMMPIKNAEG